MRTYTVDMQRAPRLLPYFGSKHSIADQLVALMPPHAHYVEPFAGSLSVLLRKPRSRIETANDIDRDLVTFWRVLRDQPRDLLRACQLTPWSRAEFTDASALPYGEISDLERARLVWVQLVQAHVAVRRTNGWRLYADSNGSGPPVDTWLRLADAATRLRGVQLECRPALDVIGQFAADPGVLLYVDPPYVQGTRADRAYLYEMPTPDEHRALADALHACKGAVMLSGYASQLYDLDLYADWHRHEVRARSGHGPAEWGNRVGRTEVVWSNRELMTQLMLPL